MPSFLRFIFTLIAAAAIIGLSVVVMGNYVGKQKQDRALEAERNRLAAIYTVAPEVRSLPAAHIAVESQEMSGSTVNRTTILIRQYRFNSMKPVILPITLPRCSRVGLRKARRRIHGCVVGL